MKLLLDRITLVCVDTANHQKAIDSLKKCMTLCKFRKVKFFSDQNLGELGFESILIDKINSKEEYSHWIVKKLYQHIDTDFVLVVQHDSWILDPHAWTDQFFDYDYIGAPWLYPDSRNIGNGGFSLRSRKLQEILGTDPFIEIVSPEDEIIGRLYRDYLEKKHGFRFPEESMADQFAFELREPVVSTFGFHSFFHPPFRPVVVVRREGAMGDVISTEPVLRYFHRLGYKIYLDTSPQFMDLFKNHDFPIEHVSFMDGRHDPEIIDLNMAYETDPQKLHLQAYFEAAGIPEPPLMPKLNRSPPPQFAKYAILHLDVLDMPYRNAYGVNWDYVVDFLTDHGYIVFQLGQSGNFISTKAIKMQTYGISRLMEVVGGSSLFVGIDSGISNIAMAMDVPSVIMFGSVESAFRVHPSALVEVVENRDVCQMSKCYHLTIGTRGTDCYLNTPIPPCVKFSTKQIISAIKNAFDF